MKQEVAHVAFGLLGPFRVTGPDGEDLTPRSLKACGLLALLLDAPRLSRPRASLQDKLWSDRSQKQGAASLRQTLTDIRHALGDYRYILGADRRSVWLEAGPITADWRSPAARAAALEEGLDFLEEIDIRDPEFEDWLRDRRQELRQGMGQDSVSGAVTRPDLGVPRLHLALTMPEAAETFGHYILTGISHGVSEFGTIETSWDPPEDPDERDPGYRLEFSERSLGDAVIASLQLIDLWSRRIEWQFTRKLPKSSGEEAETTQSSMICEGVDRVLEVLSQRRVGLIRGPFQALLFNPSQLMFRTRGLDYEQLRTNFRECFDLDPRGIYLAWQAFLACYVVGERRSEDPDAFKDEARALIREAISLEPHNSLILGLAANVYSFLLKEYDTAHELAERSVALNRDNVFGWTFLGTAKLYRGDYEGAYRCLSRAKRISGQGPYRHMVDAVNCMAALLSGRVDEGIEIGETINSLAPDFAPALRYLLAGYIRKGDLDRASSAFRRLRRLEPDFEISMLADPGYPVPALQRSGFIDLEDLPDLS